MVEQSADMLYLHALDGRILEVNESAIVQSQYTQGELLNMNIFDLHSDVSDKEEILQQWREWKPGGQPETLEQEHVRKDGSTYSVEIAMRKVSFVGREFIMAIVRDITKRKQVDKEIEFISFHDGLTELYNRRYFDEELKRIAGSS